VLPTETPVALEANVMEGLPVSVVTVANRHWEIVARRTLTFGGSGNCNQEGTSMSTLSKLHQRAAEHHEHAARHHREAAKLHEVQDVLAAVDQAHMATDHQVHAIHYATQAAKEYLAARCGS
jgi:predicted transposase YbfD/YdcC